MGKNILDPVGSGATLSISDTGTLTTDGSTACGTLTGQGSLTTGAFGAQALAGVLGDGVLAAQAGFLSLALIDVKSNEVEYPEVERTVLSHRAETTQPGLPKFGEVTVTIPWDAATAKAVLSAGGKMLFFKQTVDDYATTDSAQVFLGWFKKIPVMPKDVKKNQQGQAELVIVISGIANFASGS
jgi:hypothetical protein